MTKKGWIIFVVLCVGVFGGLVWMSRQNKADVSNVDISQLQVAAAGNGNIGDHVFGKTDSKVLLIEYGDFQCPGCGSAAPIMKKVAEKYKSQIGFVFRNYPLYTLHPNALAASTAAEAAGLQGKYWEMHDKLYESQSQWKDLSGAERTDYFANAANSLGLDALRLRNDLDNTNIKKKIDFDTAIGKKANITGTPTMYVNGKNVSDLYAKNGALVSKDVDGAQPIWSDADTFGKLAIEPALKEKGIELPKEN